MFISKSYVISDDTLVTLSISDNETTILILIVERGGEELTNHVHHGLEIKGINKGFRKARRKYDHDLELSQGLSDPSRKPHPFTFTRLIYLAAIVFAPHQSKRKKITCNNKNVNIRNR